MRVRHNRCHHGRRNGLPVGGGENALRRTPAMGVGRAYIETPHIPLHITGIQIIDQTIGVDIHGGDVHNAIFLAFHSAIRRMQKVGPDTAICLPNENDKNTCLAIFTVKTVTKHNREITILHSLNAGRSVLDTQVWHARGGNRARATLNRMQAINRAQFADFFEQQGLRVLLERSRVGDVQNGNGAICGIGVPRDNPSALGRIFEVAGPPRPQTGCEQGVPGTTIKNVAHRGRCIHVKMVGIVCFTVVQRNVVAQRVGFQIGPYRARHIGNHFLAIILQAGARL